MIIFMIAAATLSQQAVGLINDHIHDSCCYTVTASSRADHIHDSCCYTVTASSIALITFMIAAATLSQQAVELINDPIHDSCCNTVTASSIADQ